MNSAFSSNSGANVSIKRLVGRQPADAQQQRSEVLAVHVLHRKKHASSVCSGLDDVEDTADVRTCDLAGVAYFREEALSPHRIVGDRPRQKLQRDWSPELDVVGTVDLAHAAAAEQADDAIT